jgi:hypothetical protein
LSFPHYGLEAGIQRKVIGHIAHLRKLRKEIDLKIESKASMYLLAPAIGFFGTNLYDFLLRVVGSEILRTVASFIIRSALTRIGL